MAPKRGDIRLLIRSASPASARRVLLALAAIAVCLLAGCGGGSSGETTSTAARVKQEEATSQAKGSESQEESSSQVSEEPKRGAGANGIPPGAQGSGKHGQRVRLPKGEPEPTATPAEEATATVADIALTSTDVAQGAALPATFTCDGEDAWPSLQWQGIPTGTQELVLFAMNAAPVGGKLFFDWALAGLEPGLQGLESGKLPKGAVPGQNSLGKADYEICPPRGQGETYIFALYALPSALSPQKGFDPAELRRQVQAASRNVGLLAASYERR